MLSQIGEIAEGSVKSDEKVNGQLAAGSKTVAVWRGTAVFTRPLRQESG
jgi:hypothetical protein